MKSLQIGAIFAWHLVIGGLFVYEPILAPFATKGFLNYTADHRSKPGEGTKATMRPTLLLAVVLGCVFGRGSACSCFEPADYCSNDYVIQAVVTAKDGPFLPPFIDSLESVPEEYRNATLQEFGYYEYTLDIEDTYWSRDAAQEVPNILIIPTGSPLCGMELQDGARYILGVIIDFFSTEGANLYTNACQNVILLESADDVPQEVLDLDCSTYVNPWEVSGRRRALAHAHAQLNARRGMGLLSKDKLTEADMPAELLPYWFERRLAAGKK